MSYAPQGVKGIDDDDDDPSDNPTPFTTNFYYSH
jgi:hypothetical protein